MWHVGWNLPGCLPEMEPVPFDTEQEALEFIHEELERVREFMDDDPYVYWVEPAEVDSK